MDRVAPASQFDLLEEFAKPGCPVCTLIDRQVGRYMEAVNYESAGDPYLRAELTQAHGFCRDHAPQWLKIANVLATANIYNDVLKHLQPEIAEVKPSGSKLFGKLQSNDRPLFEAHQRCLACVYSDLAEKQLLTTLIAGFAGSTFSMSYASSDGVCIPHLRAAFGQRPKEPAIRVLQNRAEQTIAALRGDLELVIRHHDYRFRHEPAGAEVGSHERAIRFVTGRPERGN